MLRLALANKPAVGRLRDFALERSGEHRGLLDIKHGGLLPVTSIARYASLTAGAIAAASTPERLSAADAAGTLDGDSARSLSEAFELFQSLRLEHQVDQLERAVEPDDYVDPKALEPGATPPTAECPEGGPGGPEQARARAARRTGVRLMAVLERQSEVMEGYLRTAPPAPSLPWRQASFAVLGLEATGQDPRRDQLVSVACVPVERGKAIMAKASEATIRPGGVALEPIVEALTGRVLVAHGASAPHGLPLRGL